MTDYSNGALVNRFVNWRRLSPNTEKGYKYAINSYGMYGRMLDSNGTVLENTLVEASRETIAIWYRHVANEGLLAGTILNYSGRLRTLFQFHLTFDLDVDECDAELIAMRLFKYVPISDLRVESERRRQMRDEIIIPKEFDIIMRTIKHIRLKAETAILYESGCRIGEILGETGPRIKDVTFLDTYAVIRVLGKTGERTVPLIRSVPYLRAWLQIHPDINNPDAPLFCTSYKGEIVPLTTTSLNHVLTRACKVAGIRNINPNMTRHTRLTELAIRNVGEYQLKGFAGWTPDSRMAARYIRLSGRSHINAILEAEGLNVEDIRKEMPRTLLDNDKCPNCNRDVGRDMLDCPYCGYILDDARAVSITQGSQTAEKYDERDIEDRIKKESERRAAELFKLELFKLKEAKIKDLVDEQFDLRLQEWAKQMKGSENKASLLGDPDPS